MNSDIAGLAKVAATLGKPGTASTALANTVGQVGNLLGIAGPVVGGKSSFKNPKKEKHKKIVELLSKHRPDALSETVVRLGGPNLWDDMVWKAERDGEDLPWYKQLGGRVLQNPRTGPIGKILGYPSAPIKWLVSALTRGPNYDPTSDAVHQMWDNPSVTEHELGHAIDFNKLTTGGKIPKSLLGRLGHGTLRDLYGEAYRIPFVNLIHETEANRESEEALAEGLSKEDFLKRTKDRSKYLPSGIGSYVGAGLGSLGGMAIGDPSGALKGLGAIGGAIGGKIGGPAIYDKKEKEEAWEEGQARKKKKESEKDSVPEGSKEEEFKRLTGLMGIDPEVADSVSENNLYPADIYEMDKDKPRDGDGDGKVNDGTEEETEVKELAKAAALSAIIKAAEGEYDIAHAIAPHAGIFGASLGALGGGLKGLLNDPGYDEETGKKKSRLMAILKGMGTGGLVGGGMGVAAPYAATAYGKHVMPTVADAMTPKEASVAAEYGTIAAITAVHLDN